MKYEEYLSDEMHEQWIEDGRPVPAGRKYCTSCDHGERIELADVKLVKAPAECLDAHGRNLCDMHADIALIDWGDDVQVEPLP